MDCEACVYGSEHGWWGPSLPKGATHCSGCHRTWRFGSHCYACHDHFASGSAFDAHQKAGTCRSLSELVYRCLAHRFRLIEQSGGPTWKGTQHAEVCRDWGLCGTNGRTSSRAG